MSVKKLAPVIVSAVLLITALVARAYSVKNEAKPTSTATVDTATIDSAVDEQPKKAEKEMRGVWVSYIELDMQNETDKSEASFREKFKNIAINSKNAGFNTLIVQVRPFCDALYDSKFFPYSHILSGKQGVNPGYDALEVMCEVCSQLDLDIHAWVNPYRISTDSTPQALSETNPYMIDNEIGEETENGIFLNPANKMARNLIIDGVTEIVRNYDVDGIQFDDYFYPTQDSNFDDTEYADYVETVGEMNCMSIDNWRLANVNTLICDTYRAIHKISDNVDFGISPQGNIDNNAKIYADVKTWCICKGFVDYICPQLYYSLDNPALTFEDSLTAWSNLDINKSVKLYVGLAGYKANSDADEGTWLYSNNILADEYKIAVNNEKVSGIMLYSYSALKDENAGTEIANLTKAMSNNLDAENQTTVPIQ
ncbi:glycoside hydrolase family 10 protein [Ruminococcus sp.]|uniref:glycoside hydrolase family 10 protein n=1 Tax=Ruminococcus sp. TaxID=41978 RepID=UPI003AACC71C